MNRRPAALLALAVAMVEVACGGGGTTPSASVSPPRATASAATPSPTLAADWPEYHKTALRSGLGPAVPLMGSPQRVWSAAVDGEVYASPLIVAGHVLVATENNTVYSLDLFSGAVVWSAHLGDPVDASTLQCGNIGPVTGITGTPAADPAAGRLYVVAFLRGYHHVLFTLSLVDGKVVGQQAIDPPGSQPAVQQERGALALGSGYVYVPFGGLYGDCGYYNGFLEAMPVAGGPVLSYRVPSVREAGIWTAAGPTIAPSGSVYIVTGNGTSQSSFDYSNTVVELVPDLSSVQSYFTPSNWVSLNESDTDLGSVGATLLPTLGVVVAIGKEGVAYLLKADKLGGVGGQLASAQVCSGAWGGTAWSGSSVFIPCADGLVALSISPTSFSVAWKVGHPVLGSPIVAAGAVWAIEAGSGKLYALDPVSGAELYSTDLGAASHFSTPAATEGYVVAPAGAKVVAISTGA
ncbi:MAG TPA: PQQ-binding-like beta-propeller repeat protein [Candidatus Dormibacteraeota bacterium]|nr:PQQ-binding-like beta-propeller repeat protein [Candidatus Dormibacteraeota bacterium]